MRLVKINLETGLWIEDVLCDTAPLLDDGNPDPQYKTPPTQGVDYTYWPRWDGEKWVEGGTAPEPVEPELTDVEKLKIRQDATEDAVLFLMDMSMGGML